MYDRADRIAGRSDDYNSMVPGIAILHMLLQSLVQESEAHKVHFFNQNSGDAILTLHQYFLLVKDHLSFFMGA